MENGTTVTHEVYGDGEVVRNFLSTGRVQVNFTDYGVTKVLEPTEVDVISVHRVSQSNTKVENQAIELWWTLSEKSNLIESERTLLKAINEFLG